MQLFADMLGNLIAKYYKKLDLDKLPDPPKAETASKQTDSEDK